MKKYFIFIVILSLISFAQVEAQDSQERNYFLKHFAVGVSVSHGVGVSAHVSLSSKLNSRIGFNYIPNFKYYFDNSIMCDSYDGSKPESVKLTISHAYTKFSNGYFFLDFFLSNKFSITAGFYMGKYMAGVEAYADNDFSYTFSDATVKVKPTNKKIDSYIALGNLIKPYLGVGFGRTIPKTIVAFRFDLGIIHFGNIYAYSKNIEGSQKLDLVDFANSFANEDIKPLLKNVRTLSNIAPNIQLTLSFKIFGNVSN